MGRSQIKTTVSTFTTVEMRSMPLLVCSMVISSEHFKAIISLCPLSLAHPLSLSPSFSEIKNGRCHRGGWHPKITHLLVIIKMRKWRNSCLQQNKHINTDALQRAITEVHRDSRPPLITMTIIFFFFLQKIF